MFVYFSWSGAINPKCFYGRNVEVNIAEDVSEESDLSDDETYYREPRVIAYDTDEDEHIEKASGNIVVSESEQEDTNTSQSDDDDDIPLIHRIKKKNAQRKKPFINWKKGNLKMNEEDTKFSGDPTLPQDIKELQSPIEYFKYFFSKEILQLIVHETNLYSIQCRPNKSANVCVEDIEQFIGTCLFMSIIQLPATRNYWSQSIGHPAVSEVMNCNRWEEIKRYIHFCDNSQSVPRSDPNHDKLFKVRPLLNAFRERLLQVPKEQFLAVDEQIIPTKSRSSLKQYNPKKPHKWGYKAYVLSGVSGFSYDFEIFAGAQSNVIIPGAPDLGVSSNVVARLTQSVPRHVNYKIFFDNWFTSVPLMVYLRKEGLLSLGTVRATRIPFCYLPKEAEMKKRGRGYMEEKVATVDNVQLSAVSWYDNKVVNTLSTYVGCKPEGERKRLFKKEKEHRMITCPRSVMIYNDYMGGVDLLDSMLGYYRIQIRSKKWYLKIFFHLVDLACVNSWILWRRNNEEYLPLAEYKIAVADALCKAGKSFSRKRGRPSLELERQIEAKKKRGPTEEIPQQDVRQDGIDHFPIWKENRVRCKYPDCEGKTYIECRKCCVSLCLNKDRNCFIKFHED